MNRNNMEYRVNADDGVRRYEPENRGFGKGFVDGFCGVGEGVHRLVGSAVGIATSVAGLKGIGKIFCK